jgi:hypothetical protein
MTSIFWEMEDDLNILAYERRPEYMDILKATSMFLAHKITSTFRKFKTTSIFWPMEDDHNILANGS